jgi:1,4-dihydroxy-2-naphthoate octaprenyltransferase
MFAIILICVALIVLSAGSPKPYGWVCLGLSVLALLAEVLKWTPLR